MRVLRTTTITRTATFFSSGRDSDTRPVVAVKTSVSHSVIQDNAGQYVVTASETDAAKPASLRDWNGNQSAPMRRRFLVVGPGSTPAPSDSLSLLCTQLGILPDSVDWSHDLLASDATAPIGAIVIVLDTPVWTTPRAASGSSIPWNALASAVTLHIAMPPRIHAEFLQCVLSSPVQVHNSLIDVLTTPPLAAAILPLERLKDAEGSISQWVQAQMTNQIELHVARTEHFNTLIAWREALAAVRMSRGDMEAGFALFSANLDAHRKAFTHTRFHAKEYAKSMVKQFDIMEDETMIAGEVMKLRYEFSL
ncbi:hypothetical protein BC830DRAFT_1117642 [Chytriomyces sp. MP71]|nr:hypothetical protein BC830DRAFT_1117642 [Chytriomyces sp. MP71]